MNLRIIYNSDWIQSVANGNAQLGLQRANEVVAEAEKIYDTKYAPDNRLQTNIDFNIIGGGKKPSHE